MSLLNYRGLGLTVKHLQCWSADPPKIHLDRKLRTSVVLPFEVYDQGGSAFKVAQS